MRGVTQTRERIKFCCLLFGAAKEIDRGVIEKKGIDWEWVMGLVRSANGRNQSKVVSSVHREKKGRVKERGRQLALHHLST